MIVLGIDPGLAHCGWAAMDATTGTVIALGVVTTEKSDKKRAVRASDDNLRRARELYTALMRPLYEFQPAVLCIEGMSHPRQASSAAKLSMAWGVIAGIAEYWKLPVAQSSPQEARKTLGLKGNASKDDVRHEVGARLDYAHINELLSPIRASDREHAVDALAAILACASADVMRMARAA